MNNDELKNIAESLIDTTILAGKKSIELYKKGLKKIIKPDNSPVTNGDLEVNKIIASKINKCCLTTYALTFYSKNRFFYEQTVGKKD